MIAMGAFEGGSIVATHTRGKLELSVFFPPDASTYNQEGEAHVDAITVLLWQ